MLTVLSRQATWAGRDGGVVPAAAFVAFCVPASGAHPFPPRRPATPPPPPRCAAAAEPVLCRHSGVCTTTARSCPAAPAFLDNQLPAAQARPPCPSPANGEVAPGCVLHRVWHCAGCLAAPRQRPGHGAFAPLNGRVAARWASMVTHHWGRRATRSRVGRFRLFVGRRRNQDSAEEVKGSSWLLGSGGGKFRCRRLCAVVQWALRSARPGAAAGA